MKQYLLINRKRKDVLQKLKKNEKKRRGKTLLTQLATWKLTKIFFGEDT